MTTERFPFNDILSKRYFCHKSQDKYIYGVKITRRDRHNVKQEQTYPSFDKLSDSTHTNYTNKN